MTDELRRVWTAIPFRPFIIHLADGRAFHVPYPNRGRTLLVYTSGDAFAILDVQRVRLRIMASRGA